MFKKKTHRLDVMNVTVANPNNIGLVKKFIWVLL